MKYSLTATNARGKRVTIATDTILDIDIMDGNKRTHAIRFDAGVINYRLEHVTCDFCVRSDCKNHDCIPL